MENNEVAQEVVEETAAQTTEEATQADTDRVKELLSHILFPLLKNQDEIVLNVIEGTKLVLVELTVSAEDLEFLQKDEEKNLRAMQHILTMSSNDRKFSLDILNA